MELLIGGLKGGILSFLVVLMVSVSVGFITGNYSVIIELIKLGAVFVILGIFFGIHNESINKILEGD
jgi:hypothetical protein